MRLWILQEVHTPLSVPMQLGESNLFPVKEHSPSFWLCRQLCSQEQSANVFGKLVIASQVYIPDIVRDGPGQGREYATEAFVTVQAQLRGPENCSSS